MEDKLLKFKAILHVASFILDGLRQVGFLLLKGIAVTVDSVSGMTKSVYKLINFYNYKPIRDMIDTYQPAILALGAIGVAFLGYQMMSSKKLDRFKIINNAILAMTILVLLPWGLQQGTQLVTAGNKILTNKRSASTQVFKNNITDLYTVDKNGWKSTKTQNDIDNKTDVQLMDISEKVDTDNHLFKKSPLSNEGKKLLSKQLIMVNGKKKAANMKSFWGIGDPSYYRYSWHPWLITLELLTKLVVYCFVMFKAARMINELGLLYILTMGISLTDLKEGQRNKQLIMKIRDTLVILYMVMFLISFFDIWSAFIAEANIPHVVKGVAIAAGAWGVIDGPNFIEQLFGIDSGLSSVGKTAIAMSQTGSIGKNLSSSISKMPKNLAKGAYNGGRKVARTGAYIGGGAKGILDGFKSPKGPDSMPPTPVPFSPESTNEKKQTTDKNQANERNQAATQEQTNSNQNQSSANEPSVNSTDMANKNGLHNASKEGLNQLGQQDLNSSDTQGMNPLDEKGTNALAKEKLKGMNQPTAPLKNPKEVANGNKATLDQLGVSKKGGAEGIIDTNDLSHCQRTLQNKPQPLQDFPKVSETQFPKAVQEASAASRQAIIRDNQPRQADTESLGDKAVNLYAKGADRVLNSGTTANRTRKVYDVSKATSKRVSDQFKN